MAGVIFINYRRRDAAGTTGRLYDHLEQRFHPDELFMDVEDIPPGEDFVRILDEEVRRCDVFLAVIGPNWPILTDGAGRRLIDRDNDFVRIEIESALRHRKLIIPVLVDNGEMPAASDLPTSIQALARRNGFTVTHERFKADVQNLANLLREALDDSRASQQKTEQIRVADLDRIKREHAARRAARRSGSMPNSVAAEDTVVDRGGAGLRRAAERAPAETVRVVHKVVDVVPPRLASGQRRPPSKVARGGDD